MTQMQQAIQQARTDYAQARTNYGMVSHTDREPVAYHEMQAAWERLRAVIRAAKREAAPGEAANKTTTFSVPERRPKINEAD